MNLEETVARHDEKIRTLFDRVEKVEVVADRIESLAMSTQRIATSVESMQKEQNEYRAKQNELADRILEVEQNPIKDKANRYTTITNKIIDIVLGAVVGFLLFHFFGL